MYTRNLFLLYCFSASAIISTAQKTTVDKEKASTSTSIDSKSIEQLPFSRNINEFMIRQNFGYTHKKLENSDNSTSSINLDIDYNRFVVDHVGLGIEFDLSSSKTEAGNSTIKNNSWMAYGNVIYGTTFNSNFNLYGKLSVGVGNDKLVYPSTTSKEDLFGYKVEIGSPVHLFNDGGNYITPFIGYDYLQRKDGGAKNSDNEFMFGFRFQNYSPCDAYACDCHHGRMFSRSAYGEGRSFIGYSSMGDFGFGKTKYDYGSVNTEDDISGGLFNLEYGYYFIPNLAIGAGINWNSETTKSGSTKYTSSQFTFMPMITANLPSDDCWNNLFLQGGYGFGFEKNSSGSNDIKYSITNYCINLGFNDFFGRHLAFTPKIGYDWETIKNKDTDIKTKYSGLEFGLGGTLHF